MNKDDIGLAFIEFDHHSGGKKRPVLILGETSDYYDAFSITSQFQTKSAQIQALYFKIRQWQLSGLKKPSWVDTEHHLQIKKSTRIQVIGQLQIDDIARLILFLNSRNKR